ncbi:MAG: cbb3-type cytochrome c oxidase subunit I [Solirubrobacterales bacterium]|nr:cbb3-type cytochrome c oxidase subunit I [Solirubrobacterales bacterium]MCB8970619.1 cbb3-type cytochrome c oxidase subunit I [Thermoleophilales bacterium]MCO5328413.1 cbb3-type cytochrome c oxidase subunit I [Solirubrobacterales bacterium]
MAPPIQSAARPEVVSEQIPRRQPAWISLVTSSDHKQVGRMYVATSFFFAAIALTQLVLMRLQLIVPENTFIRPDVFDRLFTPYGVTALLLFALPLAFGLFSVVVPLQIGARGMALPRVHHLSYWLYLFGGLVIYLAFLYRPGEAGTVSLPPLAGEHFLPGHGNDAWIVGVGITLIGFVLFSVNMIATLRGSRAPGMVWRRTPLFSWSAGVVSWTLLLVSPVMIAALTMLMIDRHYDGIFFDPNLGGSPVLYEHLSSIFLAGAYISVVIAAMGAISEILPTFSRQPQFGHGTVAASMAALAPLAVLAWMQNMVAAAIPVGFLYFAMLMALLAAVPAGLVLFNWLGTLSGGALRRGAPLTFALGAIFLTYTGLVGEMVQSIPPVGWQLGNTATAWGDTHAALIGAGVFGGFAALHYWFPKLCGRRMGDQLAGMSFWALFVGAIVMIVPMQMAGLEGMPVDVFKFYEDSGLDALNLIATIGSVIFAIGFLLTMINAAISYNKGVEVGPDPWHGSTLEWFTPSPPPVHNFDLVPDVRSTEPLNDIREAIRSRETRWTPPPARVAEPEATPVAAAGAAEAEDAEAPGSEDEGDGPVA